MLAVREVLGGKTYLSRLLPKDTISCLRREGKEMVEEEGRLTERQREVLQLLAEGKQMKEVGDILNMCRTARSCSIPTTTTPPSRAP